jgi:hypothetical protein
MNSTTNYDIPAFAKRNVNFRKPAQVLPLGKMATTRMPVIGIRPHHHDANDRRFIQFLNANFADSTDDRKSVTSLHMLSGALGSEKPMTKKMTRKGQREHDKIAESIRQCGDLFPAMEDRCRGFGKKDLLKWARSYCEDHQDAVKPGRIEGRHRLAMTCWLCMNAPSFPEGVPVLRCSYDPPEDENIMDDWMLEFSIFGFD